MYIYIERKREREKKKTIINEEKMEKMGSCLLVIPIADQTNSAVMMILNNDVGNFRIG